MTSSSGSMETSANSRPLPFSFSPTSFSDLLSGTINDATDQRGVSRGFMDHFASSSSDQPNFKSIPPPSLPISPPPFSPSSFFAIPAGLSPNVLLDSPALLSSFHGFQSPTTGNFPPQSFNWRGSPATYEQPVKVENRPFSDFSFDAFGGYLQQTPLQDPQNNNNITPIQSVPIEVPTLQPNTQISNGGYQPNVHHHSLQAPQTLQRKSDDGYNWRKYGQKQVKGSENPRSYYKCTWPNCPTKKKVEKNYDGQVTEIVYKGSHNHPKPQATRRNNSASSQAMQASNHAETSENSFGGRSGTPFDSVATPENSTASFGEDDLSMRTSGDDGEPDSKRWKGEGENEAISASGNRTVREPRVVVQTTSDIDILDDGYRWRKYGQKVVKGNPNPRSYYKCTSAGCPVRKHVERASNDLRAVITTYEGKHNHDVPAARGSAALAASRLAIESNNFATAIRPSAVPHNHNQMNANSMFGVRSNQSESQGPFAFEMMQAQRSFGLSGFENSMIPYMNQNQQ